MAVIKSVRFPSLLMEPTLKLDRKVYKQEVYNCTKP